MNNIFVIYTVSVEPDDCYQGSWMVVFRGQDESIHGIPLRRVTKKKAKEMVNALTYAFEFGAAAVFDHTPCVHVAVEPKELT